MKEEERGKWEKRVKCLNMGGALGPLLSFLCLCLTGNDMVRLNKYCEAGSRQTLGQFTCKAK